MASLGGKLHLHLHYGKFKEEEHPRAASGEHGGQFIKKGTSEGGEKASSSSEPKVRHAPTSPPNRRVVIPPKGASLNEGSVRFVTTPEGKVRRQVLKWVEETQEGKPYEEEPGAAFFEPTEEQREWIKKEFELDSPVRKSIVHSLKGMAVSPLKLVGDMVKSETFEVGRAMRAGYKKLTRQPVSRKDQKSLETVVTHVITIAVAGALAKHSGLEETIPSTVATAASYLAVNTAARGVIVMASHLATKFAVHGFSENLVKTAMAARFVKSMSKSAIVKGDSNVRIYVHDDDDDTEFTDEQKEYFFKAIIEAVIQSVETLPVSQLVS